MSTRDDLRRFAARCRVTDGSGFRLAERDTGDKDGIEIGKHDAAEVLRGVVERLAAQQERLYADGRWAVLCIFQAMDAAGKDGAIKHVFTGVNPQGCEVTAFRAPSSGELAHDFLWRHVVKLPRRGIIGVHNRSWYEEVLVPRVLPEVLARQPLPDAVRGPDIFDRRLEDIAAIERHLARSGTLVLKFFLHLGREEQRQRLLARIDEPGKNWKFEAGDLATRSRWDDYMDAYEQMIRATAAPEAPWFVVPADRKWLARLVVAEAVAGALEGLGLHFPEASAETLSLLERARRELG